MSHFPPHYRLMVHILITLPVWSYSLGWILRPQCLNGKRRSCVTQVFAAEIDLQKCKLFARGDRLALLRWGKAFSSAKKKRKIFRQHNGRSNNRGEVLFCCAVVLTHAHQLGRWVLVLGLQTALLRDQWLISCNSKQHVSLKSCINVIQKKEEKERKSFTDMKKCIILHYSLCMCACSCICVYQ